MLVFHLFSAIFAIFIHVPHEVTMETLQIQLHACIHPFQHAAMVVNTSIDSFMFDGKSNL